MTTERRRIDRKGHRRILLVGSSETCPDMVYATGFQSADPVIFFQHGKRKTLVVSPMEYGRALRLPGIEIVTSAMFAGEKKAGCRSAADIAIALLRSRGVRRVTVPALFPHGIARQLRRAGITLSIARGPVFPERAVKRPEEIRRMEEAQQAAVISMRRALAVLARATITRTGRLRSQGKILTAETIRGIIQRSLLDQNCFCRNVIVACGSQGADPHERGHGELRAHQPIVIDVFPQQQEHGYWGDITRTVVKGRVAPAVRKMYTAVKAAQAAALGRIRPGVRCATVHRAAVEEISRRGFVTDLASRRGFLHGTGHGVGIEVHEAPSLTLVDERLRKGHVVTVEPGLYDPDIGGMRIEDTVVVTARGYRVLAPCEKRLEIP